MHFLVLGTLAGFVRASSEQDFNYLLLMHDLGVSNLRRVVDDYFMLKGRMTSAIQQIYHSCTQMCGQIFDPTAKALVDEHISYIRKLDNITIYDMMETSAHVHRIMGTYEAIHKHATSLDLVVPTSRRMFEVLNALFDCWVKVMRTFGCYEAIENKTHSIGRDDIVFNSLVNGIQAILNVTDELVFLMSHMLHCRPHSYGCNTVAVLLNKQKSNLVKAQDLTKNLNFSDKNTYEATLRVVGDYLEDVKATINQINDMWNQFTNRMLDPMLSKVNDSEDYYEDKAGAVKLP